MTGEMIALGGLLLALASALARVWHVLNRKIEDLTTGQARLRLDVQKEFASIGHFEKLEGKLDRIIEQVGQLGVALASHSRASTRSHSRTSDAR